MVISPDSWGSDLVEVWSDAARAAAAAARRARVEGGDWKKAARKAYLKAASPSLRRAARKGRRDRVRAGENTLDFRRRAHRFASTVRYNPAAGWVGGTSLPLPW